MSTQLIKEAQKSGLSITKEKLIEAIKRSPNKSFIVSQNPNNKTAVVVIDL